MCNAKNSHFFFQRDYMDYHQDRFEDYSLMIYNSKDELTALLPASRHDDRVVSHGGLTFGGFLTDMKMKTETMLEIFEAVKNFLRQDNVSTLIYKCMPYIYYQYPSEEDKYALFVNDAELIRRDVSSTVLLSPPRYILKTCPKTLWSTVFYTR